jgi:mono/diheme cytochrome c family protein
VPAANGEYRNIRDSFVRGKSADDIAAFIKIGRAATSPDSVSKAAMPAYGGYPFLTDQEVATIAAFVLETAK